MHRKHWSMRILLFGAFVGLNTLILLISIIIVSVNFSHSLSETSYNKYDNAIEQSSQQLSIIFENTLLQSVILNNDRELHSAINTTLYSSDYQECMESESTIQNILFTTSMYSSYVENIILYKKDTFFYANKVKEIRSIFEQLKECSWFHDIQSGGLEYAIVPFHNSYYLARPFHHSLYESNPGVILFQIDKDILKDCLSNTGDEKGSIMCVFNADDQLLYTKGTSDTVFLEDNLSNLKASGSGEKIYLNGTRYFFVKHTHDYSNWTIAALIPNSIIWQTLFPLYLQIGLLLIPLLVVSTCLAFIISKLVTQPLKPLLQSMEQSSNSDFSFHPYETRIAEINTLVSHYDIMMRKISDLIQQIKKKEEEKKLTELELLQAQISPHFIYNTLNSIRWLALMQDSPKIAEIISSFSTLLQIVNSHPTEFITVDEELTETSCYLDIMKFRYNSTIQIQWEIDEQARQYKSLKLIIQPLVENCFLHGFPSSVTDGKILVRCLIENDTLVYEIEDNGVGFVCQPGTLPSASADRHHNIGLKNIQKRIQLWFGETYGLTISSKPGHGTKVRLTQPVLTNKNELSERKTDRKEQ